MLRVDVTGDCPRGLAFDPTGELDARARADGLWEGDPDYGPSDVGEGPSVSITLIVPPAAGANGADREAFAWRWLLTTLDDMGIDTAGAALWRFGDAH